MLTHVQLLQTNKQTNERTARCFAVLVIMKRFDSETFGSELKLGNSDGTTECLYTKLEQLITAEFKNKLAAS